jgi:hypothetical protein
MVLDEEEMKCQTCNKLLEGRFEKERQLCHLCNVIAKAKLDKLQKS